MSILDRDLKVYGSAAMLEDDTATTVGGAIDTSRCLTFTDVNGLVRAWSSDAGDTTQTVTVYYRDAAGVIQNEVKTLTGQTPVNFTASMERFMKAIKSATCAGDVLVEAQTAERANTGQANGGGNNEAAYILSYDGTTKVATVSKLWAGGAGIGTNLITLDTGASAVDDFYAGMVIRMTDASIGFRIAKGICFEKAPSEILEVRRIAYDNLAEGTGGAAKDVYEKIFFKNTHATSSLTGAVVSEIDDPGGLVTFAMAAALNDTSDNGAGTRLTHSGGLTFDSAEKNVPGGGALAPGDHIGVWLKIALAAGQSQMLTSYLPQLRGQTV